jgi:hypothetical protein
VSIPLQDKNTRSFGVGRVLLNHDRGLKAVGYLPGKDTVLGDLIVLNQPLNPANLDRLEAAAVLEANGAEPELGTVVIALDVNVWRLLRVA